MDGGETGAGVRVSVLEVNADLFPRLQRRRDAAQFSFNPGA
jgi:hypothetical protein